MQRRLQADPSLASSHGRDGGWATGGGSEPRETGKRPCQRAKADHDFNEQELELKTNTELTRAIHAPITELHHRLLDEPTR
jgi:hypothetical protein